MEKSSEVSSFASFSTWMKLHNEVWQSVSVHSLNMLHPLVYVILDFFMTGLILSSDKISLLVLCISTQKVTGSRSSVYKQIVAMKLPP